MGIENSIVKLDPNKTVIDLTNQGITKLDVESIDTSKLLHLRLNKNHISDLPKDLNSLQSLTLRENDYTSVPSRVVQCIKTYPQLQVIDLSYNSISKLPSSILDSDSLVAVYLFGNRLSSLISLDAKIVTLDLGHNNLKEFPRVPSQIKILSLDYNLIDTIRFISENIKKLSLQCNMITKIDPHSSFIALGQLDLRYNNLTTLPEKFDKMFPKLKNLCLSHNNITEYPKFPLTITEVDLSFNKIKILPPNFNAYTCLSRCYLQNNEIEVVKNIPMSLQLLNLNNNKLLSFQLNHCPELAHLYVMNNNLTVFPQIKGNMFCDYIYRFNQIKKIESRYILDHTRIIDLSYNNITKIPDSLFSVSSLFDLELAGNNITTIRPIIATSSLSILNISSNPISELPKLPPTLEELYIADCNFKILGEEFAENKNLIKLVASGNQITKIPLLSSLVHIDLSNNNLVEFPKLPKTIECVFLGLNQIQFIPEMDEFQNLEILDIGFNPIQHIPSFQNCSSLKHLILTNIEYQEVLNIPHSLLNLDLTGTKLRNYKVLPFFYESLGGDGFQQRYIDKSIAFTMYPCQSNYYGDIIISQLPPASKCPIFGIIDNQRNSRFISFLADFVIDNINKFGSSKMKNNILESIEHMKRKEINNYYSASFVCIKDNKLRVSTLSSANVFVVNSKLEITQLAGKPPFTDFLSKHRIYGNLGEDHDLGQFHVHRIKQDPIITEIDLKENLKWLILTSKAVVDSLSLGHIQNVVSNASLPEEIAFKIRSLAISSLCNDNISVLVVDLQSYLDC